MRMVYGLDATKLLSSSESTTKVDANALENTGVVDESKGQASVSIGFYVLSEGFSLKSRVKVEKKSLAIYLGVAVSAIVMIMLI